MTTVEEKEFWVVGISARTHNAREISGGGEIPKLWGKFFHEAVAAKIPNQLDANIYAVYSHYASDRDGEYDLLIGARVAGTSTVPPGMVIQKIPTGRYAVFSSEQGPVEQVVPQAWQQVYAAEDSSSLGGKRAYLSDFELYDHRSHDPRNSQVDLYIGIK